MNTPRTYRIGEVAREIGVSVATLRLWEAQGLIHPGRSAGGIRRFSDADLKQLRRIMEMRRDQGLNPRTIAHFLANEDELSDESHPFAPQESDIAHGLRKRRIELQRTLRDVSEETKISISHLSAVERGQQRPSFATLLSLTQSYGIMVRDLIAYGDNSEKLVRAANRPRVPSVKQGVGIEQLSFGANRMEPQLFTIPAGAESGGFYQHRGEEFVFVMEGEITFWLGGDERYEMLTGDSLYFPSSLTHRWRNEGDQTSRVLWVSVSDEEVL